MRSSLRNALLAAAGLAAAAVAGPAFAQTLEELTVTGHALRNNAQSLSETVSYRDLDLTQRRDRNILERRVNTAAARVCRQLNEPARGRANLGRSCQDVAVRDASDQVRLAVADARENARLAAATPARRARVLALRRVPRAPAAQAPEAGAYGAEAGAVVSTRVIASPPVPDTPENRARFGGPMSHAGRRTHPAGN